MDNKIGRTVLFLRTRLPITNRRTYEGVYEYGKAHKWQVQTVRVPSMFDYAETASGRNGGKWMSDLLSFWKPDGCIVMGDAYSPFDRPSGFGGIPVVYCDAIPESLPSESNVVCIDSNAVANCAAKELLRLGLDSFAYVSYPRRLAWCEERENRFREVVELNGKFFATARLPKHDSSQGAKKAFGRWLSGLPKPIGVFAANDEVAETVANFCIQCGLSIPCDVAVVGADNDELVCENAPVSMTSVIPDFRKAGIVAAQLLNELMLRPAISQVRHFGVGCIVRRESTRRANASDAQIMKSLEYIRRHACEGIDVPDVVREIGCSRRYADLRFAKTVGWSILQEIRRVKIEKVKELLRNTRKPIGVVADFCGFRSCDDMRRTFRRFEGCSLSDWRRMSNGDVEA